ncbi:MAG: hypothetical protein ACR2NN_05770 [Bryobacteraceae bacterium]
MNCLGYYTFSFGKLKIGVRENSSTSRHERHWEVLSGYKKG